MLGEHIYRIGIVGVEEVKWQCYYDAKVFPMKDFQTRHDNMDLQLLQSNSCAYYGNFLRS